MRISFSSIDDTVSGFNCGNSSINSLVQKSYIANVAKQAETQKICINGIQAGYYSYTLSNILLCKIPDGDTHRIETSIFRNQFSSIHIEYLAIDEKYQRKRIGTMALPLILLNLKPKTEKIPVRYITLNSLIDKVEWYRLFGFEPMTTVADIDGNIPMYLDCLPEANYSVLCGYFE